MVCIGFYLRSVSMDDDKKKLYVYFSLHPSAPLINVYNKSYTGIYYDVRVDVVLGGGGQKITSIGRYKSSRCNSNCKQPI